VHSVVRTENTTSKGSKGVERELKRENLEEEMRRQNSDRVWLRSAEKGKDGS
jgi:hypothetical protein